MKISDGSRLPDEILSNIIAQTDNEKPSESKQPEATKSGNNNLFSALAGLRRPNKAKPSDSNPEAAKSRNNLFSRLPGMGKPDKADSYWAKQQPRPDQKDLNLAQLAKVNVLFRDEALKHQSPGFRITSLANGGADPAELKKIVSDQRDVKINLWDMKDDKMKEVIAHALESSTNLRRLDITLSAVDHKKLADKSGIDDIDGYGKAIFSIKDKEGHPREVRMTVQGGNRKKDSWSTSFTQTG